MESFTPYELKMTWNGKTLSAREPTAREMQDSAPTLAEWYSEAYNRQMMDGQVMTSEEALETLETARVRGDRPFLLYVDNVLAGDADFRHVSPPTGEFAIMIGRRDAQGRGLGTAFARMLHWFAFRVLKLDTVYLTVLETNIAGRRCYEKLGYAHDDGEAACAFVEGDRDIPMSLSRATFESLDGVTSKVLEIFERR